MSDSDEEPSLEDYFRYEGLVTADGMNSHHNDFEQQIVDDVAAYEQFVHKMDVDLQRIDNPTFEQCLTAVTLSGGQLAFVPKQTPEICIAAVKSDPRVLIFVLDQTPEICHAAISVMADALQYVRDKTFDLCLLAIQNGGSLAFVPERFRTQELCKAAMQTKFPTNLVYLDEQTEELCLLAVSNNTPATIRHVRNQTPAICAAALAISPHATMMNVRQQTPELCRQACALNFACLDTIRSVRHRRYALRCLVADHVSALIPTRLATSLLVEVMMTVVLEHASKTLQWVGTIPEGARGLMADHTALLGIELWSHHDYWTVVVLTKNFHEC